MALTPQELKIMKALQANPEFLKAVQDMEVFEQMKDETRIDRNHRFILSAVNATERTNFTEEERDAQDTFISDLCDVLDTVVTMMTSHFKVKLNEKGEAWHALSYAAENGQTLNLKIGTTPTHKPLPWIETEEESEEVETSEVPKPKGKPKK